MKEYIILVIKTLIYIVVTVLHLFAYHGSCRVVSRGARTSGAQSTANENWHWKWK